MSHAEPRSTRSLPVPHSPFPVPRACQRAVRMRGNRAPIAGRAICASMRTLDVCIYVFGAQSCATRLDLLRSARRGPDSDRAWHLGCWEAILGPRRSLREKPSPLPSSSRRYAAQYFVGWIQPPRLAPRSAAHPPNRGSVFSLRSRLVPRPTSRTTSAVAFLSLIPAATLSHRLRSGQPMVSRACRPLRL